MGGTGAVGNSYGKDEEFSELPIFPIQTELIHKMWLGFKQPDRLRKYIYFIDDETIPPSVGVKYIFRFVDDDYNVVPFIYRNEEGRLAPDYNVGAFPEVKTTGFDFVYIDAEGRESTVAPSLGYWFPQGIRVTKLDKCATSFSLRAKIKHRKGLKWDKKITSVTKDISDFEKSGEYDRSKYYHRDIDRDMRSGKLRWEVRILKPRATEWGDPYIVREEYE